MASKKPDSNGYISPRADDFESLELRRMAVRNAAVEAAARIAACRQARQSTAESQFLKVDANPSFGLDVR